jgi:hypothetical protein
MGRHSDASYRSSFEKVNCVPAGAFYSACLRFSLFSPWDWGHAVPSIYPLFPVNPKTRLKANFVNNGRRQLGCRTR